MLARVIKKTIKVFVLIACTAPAHAQIYHYVDDSGKRVFVDSPSKIPSKYSDQVQVRKETSKRAGNATDASSANEALPAKISAQLKDPSISKDRKIALVEAEIKRLVSPYTPKGDKIIFPIEVFSGSDRVVLKLLFNPQASTTVIHRKSLGALNVKYSKGKAVWSAAGEVTKADGTVLDKVIIGPLVRKRIGVSVIVPRQATNTIDGVLGADFIAGASHSIDKERNWVIWDQKQYQALQSIWGELNQAK